MSKELKNSNFYCPITDEIMNDPVIDYEGNSYERSAIVEWLRLNGTSPITRSPLNVNQLVPNRSLRKAIEDELLHDYEMKNSGDENAASTTATKESKDNDNQIQESKVSDVDQLVTLTMTSNENKTILLSILQPDAQLRCPLDIVCVVDVSGSMGESAIIKDVEDNGLSLLDIVKHALKTIVVTLTEEDRFALVTYSNEARVIFSLTPLNSPGKARVNRLIDELSADGMTNLWDGLEKGLDILTNDRSQLDNSRNRNSVVFLLTDGVPNVDPPRGYAHRLRRYRDSHGGVYPGVISTFGFGYNLKSSLLKEIAVEGDGMYMFIPDSGFVGTAFVNALSNQLVSIGSHATLEIKCSNGIRFLDHDHSHLSLAESMNKDCSLAKFHVGTLPSGQRRNFLIQCTQPESMSQEEYLQSFHCRLTYSPYSTSGNRKITEIEVECTEFTQSSELLLEIEVQSFRNRLIYYLFTNTRRLNNDNSPADGILANDMREWLANHPKSRRGTSASDKFYDRVEGMLLDLTGQITEALTVSDYFTKWGTHYLPSLHRAHELEQCTNFKDPGVQHYGGQLFHNVSEKADEMFCTLPPPTQSRTLRPTSTATTTNSSRTTNNQVPSYHQPVTSMSMYHCAAAPCFHGSCLVTLADGKTTKRVDQICQGDYVLCPSSTRKMKSSKGPIVAQVQSMLRTFSSNGYMNLIKFEIGLLVTPWHPVKYQQQWMFPAVLHETMREEYNTSFESIQTEAVYSFLLGPELDSTTLNKLNNDKENNELVERGQSMLINGVECITLAHGIQNDEVATHLFYGTEAIVNEMKKKKFQSKLPEYVDLQEGDVLKDPVTNMAVGFRAIPN